MARGLPDDSNIVSQKAIFTLDDHAELAARTGSPVLRHRYGSVIWLDRFESGPNQWDITPFVGDAFCRPSNGRVLSMGVSARLCSGTGATPSVKVDKALATPILGKIGFAYSFSLEGAVAGLTVGVVYFTPAFIYHFYIDYDHPTGNLRYMAMGGGYVVFGNCGVLSTVDQLFHDAKMIIDLATLTYSAFTLDGVNYPIPQVIGDRTAPGQRPYMEMVFSFWGDGEDLAYCWIDDVIVTQNEFHTLE